MKKYLIRILHIDGVLEGLFTLETVTMTGKPHVGNTMTKTGIRNSRYMIVARWEIK